MSDAPTGYAAATAGAATIVAVPAALDRIRDAVLAAGSLHEFAADSPTSFPLTGRGAAYVLETGGDRWVVRHYHRGGWLARTLADRYLRVGEPRPIAELRASERARERGVRTPRVAAAVIYPTGAFYRADLATDYVPGSLDLYEATLGRARLEPPARVAAWRATGQLLRGAWDAGVTHPDLNLRNVLVAGSAAWLLDLDRARVGRPVGPRGRAAMLSRLHRSRLKLERRSGERVGEAELTALAEALRG